LVSTDSQTASLIDFNNASSSVNGNVTVQRYFTGANRPKMFGSPVVGSTVGTLGEGVWKALLYTETGQEFGIPRLLNSFTGSFRNANLVHSGALTVGRGYSIRKDASGTANFTGAVNNGSISLPVTNTVGNSFEITPSGFNLLSNPYPSALDWAQVNVNGTGASASGVQIWNGSTYTASATIGSGQGFFIRATTSGNILLTNAARIGSGTANNSFLRTEQVSKWLYLYAKNTNGGFHDALAFTFHANASASYDTSYDIPKIFVAAAPSSPLLFTRPSGTRLSLDVRPYPTTDLVIPFSIIVNSSGTYAFTTSAINDWYSDYSVFLKDSTSGGVAYTNMKTVDKYEFTKNTTDTDASTRFSMVFKYTPQANNSTTTSPIGGGSDGNGEAGGDTTSNADDNITGLFQGLPDRELRVDAMDTTQNTTPISSEIRKETTIYTIQNSIVIEFSSDLSNSDIEVYDLLGQQVYVIQNVRSKETKIIPFNYSPNKVYVVKVVNNKEFLTKKIILY